MAVVTVAKVEGDICKIPRARSETFCSCQGAEARHVSTKAQTGHAMKDTREMER